VSPGDKLTEGQAIRFLLDELRLLQDLIAATQRREWWMLWIVVITTCANIYAFAQR
jgi:hypothetical protein